MTVLVIAPHPDDEAIGPGGTLCLHKDRGDAVHAVFLTSGELGLKTLPREKAWQIREEEVQRAAKILGVAGTTFLRQPDWCLGDHIEAAASALTPVLQKLKPEMIYLPHTDEWHPDHKACWPILQQAIKAAGITPSTIRGYEVWTPLANYDDVEDISKVMSRKLEALREHKSQVESWPYDKAVQGLNQFRGVMAARSEYAEVFQRL